MQKQSKPMRTAIIGIGYWGAKVMRYLVESPEIDLVYVCNSSSDLTEVWNDDSVEAVVICTPIQSHGELVLDALSAGKHVLVEKPLSTSPTEGVSLLSIAASKGLTLLVDYVQTFAPSIINLVGLVKSGELGTIRHISAETSHLGRFGMGYDVYWLLASHWLSVVDMLEPLESMEWSSLDHLRNPDDRLCTSGAINGFLRETGDHSVQIRVSTDHPGKVMRMVVYCEGGCVAWDGVDSPTMSVVKHSREPRLLPAELTKHHSCHHYDEGNNLRHAVATFVHQVRNGLPGNADSAVQVTNVITEATTIEGGPSW